MENFDDPFATSFDTPDLTDEQLYEAQAAQAAIPPAPREPTQEWIDRWESEGKFITELDTDSRWRVGKWLDEGYKKFGMSADNEYMDEPTMFKPSGTTFYQYASGLTGLTPGHLKDLRSTWDRWQPVASVRTDSLSWSHHRVLINKLKNPTEDRLREWVGKAAENKWTVGTLLKELRGAGQTETPLPSGFYKFVVKVPKRTWETLKRLGLSKDGPQQAAADILIEYCDEEGTKINAKIAEDEHKEAVHNARVRNGHKVAQEYNPLRMDRD